MGNQRVARSYGRRVISTDFGTGRISGTVMSNDKYYKLKGMIYKVTEDNVYYYSSFSKRILESLHTKETLFAGVIEELSEEDVFLEFL
jgi:hypothetical protein